MNYERKIKLSLAAVVVATTITASPVFVSAQEPENLRRRRSKRKGEAAIRLSDTSQPSSLLRQRSSSRHQFKCASNDIAHKKRPPRPHMSRRQSRLPRCFSTRCR